MTNTLFERLKPEFKATLEAYKEKNANAHYTEKVLKENDFYTELTVGQAMSVILVLKNETFLELGQLANLFNESNYEIE
jgi:hypothetical protein